MLVLVLVLVLVLALALAPTVPLIAAAAAWSAAFVLYLRVFAPWLTRPGRTAKTAEASSPRSGPRLAAP